MPAASRISIRSRLNSVDEPALHAAVIVMTEDVVIDEAPPEIKRRRSTQW